MNQGDYVSNYRAAQDALRGPIWDAARNAYDNGSWWGHVTEHLMLAADGEQIEYVETVGEVETGKPIRARVYSATRRIDINTAFHGPSGPNPVETTVRSRRGLQRVQLLRLGGGSREEWPTALALEVAYAGEEPFVLGEYRNAATRDYAAGGRLAGFYPSLLADLGRP